MVDQIKDEIRHELQNISLTKNVTSALDKLKSLIDENDKKTAYVWSLFEPEKLENKLSNTLQLRTLAVEQAIIERILLSSP